MKVKEDFIKSNSRIQIISDSGSPIPIPESWRPILRDCDVMVVIPDLHMYIHDSPLDNFKYGKGALISLLNYFKFLKDSFEDTDNSIRLYQLGDMYEYRFPGPNGNCTAKDIRFSNNDYSIILDTFDSLNVNKIYGNHDFENRHFNDFKLNYLQGKVYLEHGFAGDIWTANPENPLWDIAMLAFLGIREINDFFDKIMIEAGQLQKDKTLSFGVTPGNISRKNITSEGDYLRDNVEIKRFYCDRLKNGMNGKDCRISIIGHTHQPYVDVNVDNGNYMYIDAGGWTEGRSDFVVVTNEELAICHYSREENLKV
jgi:predicted phosphodiesterase